MVEISIKDVIIDDFVYAREQKDSKNIEVLVEKLKAGIILDPIQIQRVSGYEFTSLETKPGEEKKEVIILLDGGHRLDAYEEYNKLAQQEVEELGGYKEQQPTFIFYQDEVLDYEQNKLKLLVHAHNINDDKGLNARMQDTRKAARNMKLANPNLTAEDIGRELRRARSTITPYIQDIVQRQQASDKRIVVRLSKLGWTQTEISEIIGKTHQRVAQIANNVDTNIICNSYQEGKSIEEIASFNDLDIQTTWNIVLDGKSDEERAKELGIDIKKYSTWNYTSAHELMGNSEFKGRIPGEIPFNIIHWFSKQDDLVIDPMAGSGTTIDAALLLNRKCRGYDISPSRPEIKQADTTKEIPDSKKADLIFVNPPYWKVVDYDCPLCKRTLDEFYDGMLALAQNCYGLLKEGGYLAFMMGNQSTKIDDCYQPTLNLIDPTKQRILETGFKWYMDISCPYPTEGANIWAQAKWDKGYLADLKREIMVFRR